MSVVRSFIISVLRSRSCPRRRTHKLENVQTTITNDYSNNVFFSLGEVNGQFSGSTSPIFPAARSLNNSRNFSVTHHRHGYDVHRIWAFVARRVDANHQGAGGTMFGGHRCPLAVRVALNTRAIGSGRAVRTRSTQQTSTVITLIFSGAYCFSLTE